MTPEAEAREHIDALLEAAGWVVQDRSSINLGAALGVAVREVPTQAGPVDYALFVVRRPVGVVEAKAVGTTLGGVAEQSAKYLLGTNIGIPSIDRQDWGTNQGGSVVRCSEQEAVQILWELWAAS